jgi:hypothetical protein
MRTGWRAGLSEKVESLFLRKGGIKNGTLTLRIVIKRNYRRRLLNNSKFGNISAHINGLLWEKRGEIYSIRFTIWLLQKNFYITVISGASCNGNVVGTIKC